MNGKFTIKSNTGESGEYNVNEMVAFFSTGKTGRATAIVNGLLANASFVIIVCPQHIGLFLKVSDIDIHEELPVLWVSCYALYITMSTHLKKELILPVFKLRGIYTRRPTIDLRRMNEYKVHMQNGQIVIHKKSAPLEGYTSSCFCNDEHLHEE